MKHEMDDICDDLIVDICKMIAARCRKEGLEIVPFSMTVLNFLVCTIIIANSKHGGLPKDGMLENHIKNIKKYIKEGKPWLPN